MKQLEQIIESAVTALYDLNVSVSLTRPDEQFGDYATNIALQLSKQLGKNPRDIAAAIADKVRENASDDIKQIDIAGPGFLNITLSDAALLSLSSDKIENADVHKSVVIETNNPNPFKAMHIGHAFNAILADSIANLIEHGGATVHRVSYHGDVGQHVGRSMWSLLRYVDGDVSKLSAISETDQNTFMSKMYAEGSRAYKEDETVKQEVDALAQQSFTLDDPLYKSVYETCLAWSFKQIDALVALLGNVPTERRYLESQADAKGVLTVRSHVPDVFEESDGAYIFRGSQYGTFDNVFVASNGRGLYAARDLGLMQLKRADYPEAAKSYIVTAEEQRDYFKGVIKAAELCQPELGAMTVNVSTGTLKLSTGKMSSRSGDVVEVQWLFDEVGKAMAQRGGDIDPLLVAGALRYQFLKVRIGGDVVFDISESVSLQGNSGPYLQYAHARARSILAKDGAEPQVLTNLEQGERTLVRKLTEYNEVVARATEELMPHHICNYLYELCQSFNRFYEHNRVIGDPREAQRRYLVQLYADTLKDGLSLLGIHAPEKM